jgi:hypothetical protein
MAYPTVSAPYGLRPVSSVDGKPYAGATRQLRIALGDDGLGGYTAEPIFYGDLVYFNTPDPITGARLIRWNTPYNAYPVGVFVGCTYTNPVTKQPTWSQYWPGPLVAPDAVAYVIDDPMALFKVVYINVAGEGGLLNDVVASAPASVIGVNVTIATTFNNVAGNTNTGDSYMAVFALEGDGISSVRVIDVVPETKTDSGYPELLVKIQPHQYNEPSPLNISGT